MNVFVLSGDVDSQKVILQANIPFLDLYNRAIFTYMSDPADDPYAEDVKTPRNEFYQRRVDLKRVNEIKKYIKTSILGQMDGNRVAVIFPTAMLLAASSISEMTLQRNGRYELNDIIVEDECFYIVDGQHRLFSMKSLYEDLKNSLFRSSEEDYIINYLESYLFNCNILLNYDLWEQAQVFADVNFNQKKVSSSLYYSIYGMNYSQDPSDLKRNYLFITHQLVKVLNFNDLSPLRGFIKMLGSGNGFISQAFIADNLMKNIKSPRGIWYVDPYDMKRPPIYRYMTIELLTFFSAVKDVFINYWPIDGNQKSIICKTTGIGALLRLMAFLHDKMSNQIEAEMKLLLKAEIYLPYKNFVKDNLELLKGKEKEFFSLSGPFSGTGGRGLEMKLFREMRDMISK